MLKFLAIRVGESLIALLVISVLVFALTHLSGSPADAMLPDDATPAQAAALIEEWGLDRPLPVQYATFLGNALQGDFGDSLKWRGQSATEVVMAHLPATLWLGGFAILISVGVAIPLGVVAARRKDTWTDGAVKVVALLGQSLPPFWLGIILIWIFAVSLSLLPTSGRGGFSHLILPAIAMSWFQIAAIVRLTRSAMLDVLDAEYIKLARLKGLPESVVVWKHALRNAAIVPLTYFGVLAGSILTGSVVIETVFAWPGIGWLAIEAIRGRDFPVVQTVVIVFAVIFLLANLLVDLLYAVVDPRIRRA
jgi:peptide/nickel transport system permease protein